MAQPPEPSPLRLQSSLDSAPVQPRVQPDLDALVQKHYHDLPQQQQHQQQTRLDRQSPPSLLQTSDAPSTDSCAHSIDSRRRRSSGVIIEKAASDGVSRVNTSSHNHASVANPLDSTQNSRTAHSSHSSDSSRNAAQHNRDVPAPIPSDMSNTQPPPRPPRQPVTYASPVSYPPAGMPHYTYAADPFRPTPTTLPSMRTLDHGQPQPQPQHGLSLSTHMAAPMAPAPAPAPMGYYAVHPHAHMYGISDPNAMRFPLPSGLAHDPRIALSGGRHKKEIKRRTKTGCLTCRKRRIKCDEAHPTCNNCKKSKRECLGYDPIFKQQQGPAVIQPAPSSNSQPPAPAPAVPAPTVPSSAAHHPYQTSYPPPLPSSLPPDSVVTSTSQNVKTEPAYLYSAAIDPALQGSDAPSVTSTRPPRYQQPNTAAGAEQGAGDLNHLRGGTPSSPSTLSALSQPQSREIMSAHTSSPAKKMKVDELIALGGPAPQPPSSPPPAHILDEITKLYYEVYVPGLTSFFETRWYDFASPGTATNPAAVLYSNQNLISLFASFVQTINKIQSTDPADMVHAGHLETCVVWALACLPFSASSHLQDQKLSGPAPVEDDLGEARGRLQVFESLISGETLTSNPLSAPTPASTTNTPRRTEFEFWYHLANYLLQDHASASPGNVSAREGCLNVMRSRLDGRENRDVLYSIAVLREYTAHWDASWNEQTVPSHLDESDPRSKLAVATRFIRGESTSSGGSGGTTNVVRRFADLACRAFVRPGVNVHKTTGRN